MTADSPVISVEENSSQLMPNTDLRMPSSPLSVGRLIFLPFLYSFLLFRNRETRTAQRGCLFSSPIARVVLSGRTPVSGPRVFLFHVDPSRRWRSSSPAGPGRAKLACACVAAHLTDGARRGNIMHAHYRAKLNTTERRLRGRVSRKAALST